MTDIVDLNKLDFDELEEIVQHFARTGQKDNVELMREYMEQRKREKIKGEAKEEEESGGPNLIYEEDDSLFSGSEFDEYIVDSSDESSSEEDDCVDELDIKVCTDSEGFYCMM